MTAAATQGGIPACCSAALGEWTDETVPDEVVECLCGRAWRCVRVLRRLDETGERYRPQWAELGGAS